MSLVGGPTSSQPKYRGMTKLSPAGVKVRRRVVRVMSFNPSSASSSAIARLTLAFGTLRARAAAVKPFKSTTLAKVAIWAGDQIWFMKLPLKAANPCYCCRYKSNLSNTYRFMVMHPPSFKMAEVNHGGLRHHV